MKRIVTIAVMALALASCGKNAPVGLKVEGRIAPEGVDAVQPRLSWTASDDQKTFRIQIAPSANALGHKRRCTWDSGNMKSAESVFVPYGGQPLAMESDWWWRVKTNGGPWSKPAHFSTGIDSTAWDGAQWIGVDEHVGENETKLAARYLRREIDLKGKVESAKMYFCGLGMGVVTVNGRRVCPDVFAHPPVLFKATVYYRTYDVTNLLHKGKNALGVILGCGRYQDTHVWYLRCVTDPRMKLCLKIRYKDGSEESFVSDASWMATSKGPVTCNNEFDGEKYDARMELGKWDVKGYKTTDIWGTADIMEDPAGQMRAMPMDDMQVQDHVRPVSVKATADGRYIIDMGINMVGYVGVSLYGTKDAPVTLKFAEHLTADGNGLDMANLRDAEATDIYTPSRTGMFDWTPLFPYHGFRYVEISGAAKAPSTDDVTGFVIYDKMEILGSFECSDERLNALYANIFRGLRSNYRGMPTDCPQRDERQGWLGDRGATVWSEPYMFGCDRLYLKWMRDIFDSMHKKGRISVVSPRNWTIYNNDMYGSVVFLYIADMLYTRFGDDSGIKEYYPAMKKWFDYVTDANLKDGIFTMKNDEYCDWCCPPESLEIIHAEDPTRLTASEVIQTGVLCDAIRYMMKFARMTGNESDVPALEQMLADVKEAYNARFFDAWTAKYDNNTMTANLVPLAMGIVPEGREDDVMANIVDLIENVYDGHHCVGNAGIRYLMQSLTHHGYADLAYRLATQDTYPGWGYMMKKGATTVWELWNGDTAEASMNSENHVMMIGDLLAWYYEDLAGIKCAPDAVAFDKIEMEPCFPDGLSWVKASYKSPYGLISSEWRLENGSFVWDVTIPVHTTASVRIPVSMGVKTSGLEASEVGGKTVITLGPGHHVLKN